MQVLNYTKLRNNLKKVIDSVVFDKDTVMINRGEETAVLISLDEYNSWKETDYLLKEEANRSRLLKAVERSKKGEIETHQLIED